MHPDKLAQKGKTVTAEDQAKFQRMKEAYEVLSDPHKRETYDAIGDRGMKWIEEPLSMDPQEMATNFANSSTLDRSKIFSIFVFFAVAIFIQPLLICLQLDGQFGYQSQWTAVLTPLWIWNAFILFYHTRVIMMGNVPRPDHIPEEEWKDPLPMKKRIVGFVRFLLFFAFEIQLALHLDGVNSYSWVWVLVPLFILEAFMLYKKFPESRLTIVTLEEIQSAIGKPFAEFTEEEKRNIERAYLLIPERDGDPYDAARKVVSAAKMEVTKTLLRIIFMMLVLFKVDGDLGWNWWLIFTPFFVTSACICWGNVQNFAEVQAEVDEKLRTRDDAARPTDYGAMEEGEATTNANAEGGQSGAAPPLTEEQKNEIKGRLARSGSAVVASCCSQTFFLILLCLGLSKIQGAGFSTVWIISPFLLFASIILCLLGCMIFCVAPIEGDDEMMFGSQNPVTNYYNMDNANAAGGPTMTPMPAPVAQVAPTVSPPIVIPPVVLKPEVPTTSNPVDLIGELNPATSGVSSVPTDEAKHLQVVKETEELKASASNISQVASKASMPVEPVNLLDIPPQPSDEGRMTGPTPSDDIGIGPTISEVEDLD